MVDKQAERMAKVKAHQSEHGWSLAEPLPESFKLSIKITFGCTSCGGPAERTLSVILAKPKPPRCRSCSGKASHTVEAKERYKATMVERYGVDNPLKSEVIKQRVRETSETRYGEGGSIGKAREAFKEKHGVANPFDLPEVQENIKAIVRERYGVDSLVELPEIRALGHQALRDRWGTNSVLRGKLLEENGCHSYEEFCQKVANTVESSGLPASNPSITSKFKTDGTTLITALRHIGRDDLVRDLNTSTGENELRYFVQSLYRGALLAGDRSAIKPKELDVYLPELGIAFEYNGEIWHSERFGGDKRDYEKYLACKRAGINLYTIYETEWETRKPQVRQFIRNLLATDRHRVYARKTKITEDQDALRDFVEAWHIQGVNPRSIYYGLVLGGEIVCAIGIGAHHRGGAVPVLTRVTFGEISVVGGLQKLLKYQPHPELITWSDNRFSPVGGMYQNAGFVLETTLGPDYRYVDNGGQLYHKQGLTKRLTGCPPEMTEKDWCYQHGLYRIWDCGKLRWGWKRG